MVVTLIPATYTAVAYIKKMDNTNPKLEDVDGIFLDKIWSCDSRGGKIYTQKFMLPTKTF